VAEEASWAIRDPSAGTAAGPGGRGLESTGFPFVAMWLSLCRGKVFGFVRGPSSTRRVKTMEAAELLSRKKQVRTRGGRQ
jgi:hypothetical protein